MSKYTTEVRYICEAEAGLTESAGYGDVDNIINVASEKIFNFNIQIPEDVRMYDYRPSLCRKILEHYYVREIGLETVGLWKLRLRNKLREIMPYYAMMYKATDELVDKNIFNDVDYERQTDSTVDLNVENSGSDTVHSETVSMSESDATTTNESTDYNLYSDTPQGGLTGVKSGEYLTNATERTGDNTNTTNGSTEGNSDYDETRTYGGKRKDITTQDKTETVRGKMGVKSYSAMYAEYLESIKNIDAMIIDELKDLFMMIY